MIDLAFIDALRLTELPAQRRAEYQKVFANCEAAAVALVAANKALAAAHEAHADLSHRAASHANVGPGDIVKRQAAIRDAEAGLAFAKMTATTAENLRLHADQLLARAEADSYLPVRDAGVELRVNSAEAIEALEHKLREARADFDRGTEIVNYCSMRGFTNGLPAGGPLSIACYMPPQPSTGANERKLWGWAPRQPSKGAHA